MFRANVIRRCFIGVASWVAGIREKGVERTIILGKRGDGPVVICTNVLIGHLGTPVSPFLGRQKIVLHLGQSVVEVLIVLVEHFHSG